MPELTSKPDSTGGENKIKMLWFVFVPSNHDLLIPRHFYKSVYICKKFSIIFYWYRNKMFRITSFCFFDSAIFSLNSLAFSNVNKTSIRILCQIKPKLKCIKQNTNKRNYLLFTEKQDPLTKIKNSSKPN
jgi:hypothetical protein